MSTQLSVYNGALRLLGERQLLTVSEANEPRRLLDGVWDDNGVRRCLQRGQWFFGRRSVQLEYDPDYEAPFGYARQFAKDTDFVRLCALCTDPYFTSPLLQYTEEGGFWFADIDTIFVTYVSDDASYGGNLAVWPESFAEFVECFFAVRIAPKLTGITSDKVKELMAVEKKLFHRALADDAQAGPTRFPPPGRWTLARRRGNSARRDGGNTGSLIG